MNGIAVDVDATDGLWYRAGDAYVRGHAFLEGDLHRAADLLGVVEGTPPAAIGQLVEDLEGLFSIVRTDGETAALAVDHVRSRPLFFAATDEGVYVSNDAHWIKGQLDDPRVDPLRELELHLSGVVTGRDTLYPDIEAVGAGEYAVIDAAGSEVTVERSRYDRFDARTPRTGGEDDLLEELDAVVERSFERLLELADGRQLALSLSGGPDSRVIACMLSRLGYDDLLAFTFGREGNWDSTTAVAVADALEIPIEVVTYDHDMWFDWYHSDERVDYHRYAFNFDAPPAIGAVPAMGELRRRGAIDDDAIVLCGNCVPTRFDYPPGLQRLVDQPGAVTREDLADIVLNRYFDRWGIEDDGAAAAIRGRVASRLPELSAASLQTVATAYKDWLIRNMKAKLFISPEEYAFRGFDSWMPLWDPTCMRFWEAVPVEFLENKRLHIAYADQLFREVTNGERPPVDHVPTGPIRTLEGLVGRSPIQRVVRPVYERFEAPYKRLTRPSPHGRDPVATFGIVTEAQFEALHRSYDQDFHAFETLELLGCVSFDPPENHAGPVDGVLSPDAIRSADHERRRESLPWMTAEVPDGRETEPVAEAVD